MCFLHTPQGRFELLHMYLFLAFTIENVEDLSLPQDAYTLGPGERILFYLAVEGRLEFCLR